MRLAIAAALAASAICAAAQEVVPAEVCAYVEMPYRYDRTAGHWVPNNNPATNRSRGTIRLDGFHAVGGEGGRRWIREGPPGVTSSITIRFQEKACGGEPRNKGFLCATRLFLFHTNEGGQAENRTHEFYMPYDEWTELSCPDRLSSDCACEQHLEANPELWNDYDYHTLYEHTWWPRGENVKVRCRFTAANNDYHRWDWAGNWVNEVAWRNLDRYTFIGDVPNGERGVIAYDGDEREIVKFTPAEGCPAFGP